MKLCADLGLILGFLVPITAFAADGWQDYMTIQGNYFEGTGNDTRIVLTMSNTFHTCGWNNTATIHLSAVGEPAFKNLTAVVLTAVAANRTLSLSVDGCIGDRAKVVGLRLRD